MTFEASPYPAHPLKIRYVDPPRDAMPVRRGGATLNRVAIVAAAAATLLVAAIGMAAAAGAGPDRVVDGDPAVPAVQWRPSLIPAPGSGGAGPDLDEPVVQWRPSLIPDQGGVSLAIPKPGDVIFTPKPPGRVPAA